MKMYERLYVCLLCLALQCVAFSTPTHAALTANSMIFNQAQLFYNDAGVTRSATASASVIRISRTPSIIEFLTYAPLLPGANLINISTTPYRNGSTLTDQFTVTTPPVPVGTTVPIDLSQPVPLVVAAQFHQGEPLFVRLTDVDQDQNSSLTETVLVSLSNPATGDSEVIRLTETGPSSGVFAGYLATTAGPANSYDGNMSVKEGNILAAHYIDVGDDRDVSSTTILIDPYGIVFDSSSGQPVNGATISLINIATGLPAAVFGDDGVSSFPATLTSGSSATDSSGRMYTFKPGGYRYPYVKHGSYQLLIISPPGFKSPSTVATTTITALPGGPFTITTGSRGEVFIINPGPALRIDIPLDPSTSVLWLQKSTSKNFAGHGDFVPYQLTLTNNGTSSAMGILVNDILPIGFRLRSGSVSINKLPVGDPLISADGRTLTFSAGSLAGSSLATLEYVAEVTVGTKLGPAVNNAIAHSGTGSTSNRAQAIVTIRDDFLRTRSTLMGRITTAACSEDTGEGANGVEGVRVYLEDGSFVISDTRGLFHFEGVQAGLHVVQMDLDSVPDGLEAHACNENSRFSGRTFSQFVETQGGTLWRTDFHLRPSKVTTHKSADSTAKTAAVLTDHAKSFKDADGIQLLGENNVLLHRINSIRIRLDSRLKPRLLVDNREVPVDRIGFSMKDEKSGCTYYSYIGVDFGERGEHVIQLNGIDPFGNSRFRQTIPVKLSGEIASIRLKSADGNVADGITPVRLKFEFYDADGTLIPAGAELQIREGTLNPLKQPDLFSSPSAVGSFALVQTNKSGEALFQPVNSSGLHRVLLGYNGITLEAETYVQPKLRDWILVGLAEGTLGYNTASGNMQNFQGTDTAEDLYKDGRIALFAKGQLQGKWLLTMAYDTAKVNGSSPDGLFQTISPESYYTLYGDASQQQYDAASTKKLYLRIEREQFYAMFGDFDTGLTVTELSRYSRRMTGLKTELQGKSFEINAFVSENGQAYQRDEIPGEGTSGIYRLTRRSILPNSEKIAIEVRDRFRSEILVSSRTLNRFTDYSIDYDTGAVIFKEPVYSRDLQLNPLMIVAEYEVAATSGQDFTYGGRAGLKLFDQQLKLGGSYIHEGQGDHSGNLYGLDTSLKLGESTRLRAEVATSDVAAGSNSRNGNAYLAEVLHTTKLFDAKAYFREQQNGFGLGQQAGSEAGTRKAGIEGRYRVTDRFNTYGNIYRQYNLQNSAIRDVAEGKLNFTEKHFSSSFGVLNAEDRLGDGTLQRSTQLILGGKTQTLYDRLTLTLEHAHSIGKNSNSDFPTRTILGAEFLATKNLTLLAAQELTWGTGATTQNTRLGIRTTPWGGSALTSSVEHQFNDNDERVFANVGLKQSWQISTAWKIDAGLERSQTLTGKSHYQFKTNVPAASGGGENFTSVSSGASYLIKHLTWDNRFEFRNAASENKWGLMSGLVNEVDKRWAWSGRAQIFQTTATGGIDTTKANLRYGLIIRPPETKWIVLNRLDYQFDRISGNSSTSIASWRVVNNLISNYRPHRKLQISLQYGVKYVQETISKNGYSSFSDHIGFESRYDITKKWDVGIRGSLLHSWQGGQYDYSCGPSAGFNIFDNTWISVGYNLIGFEDKDFSSAAYTVQGPYVRFRMKFDQQSVKEAAAWLNRQ